MKKLIYILLIFLLGCIAKVPAETELNQEQLWAIGLAGIMTERNQSNHTTLNFLPMNSGNRRIWLTVLRRDYGITNKRGLLNTLDNMELNGHAGILRSIQKIIIDSMDEEGNISTTEIFNKLNSRDANYLRFTIINWDLYRNRDIMVWDLGRNISLCRWGYEVGFLTEEEAWDKIMYYANLIKPLYNSWEEYGYDYFLGRVFWSSGFGDEDNSITDTYRWYNYLISESGYWHNLKWGTSPGIPDQDVTATPEIKTDEYKAIIRRCREYYTSGDYDNAISAWTEALRVMPGDLDALNSRGLIYAEIGEIDKAIADYSESIRIRPNDHTAFHNRGITYANLGDYTRAIADYSEALRIMPDNFETLSARGSAFHRNGDLHEAIGDYSAILKIRPSPHEALSARGNVYYENGDYDNAIEDYTAVLRMKPESINALNSRGLAYYEKDDYDKAIEDYTTALKIRPGYYYVLYNRGLAYNQSYNYENAIEDFTAALKAFPDDSDSLYCRGLAYNRKGDIDSAIADWEAVLQIEPNHASAKWYLERVRQEY